MSHLGDGMVHPVALLFFDTLRIGFGNQLWSSSWKALAHPYRSMCWGRGVCVDVSVFVLPVPRYCGNSLLCSSNGPVRNTFHFSGGRNHPKRVFAGVISKC